MSESGAPSGGTLEQWVGHFLRTVPETWTEFDTDALSESQEQAVSLLTAAGMIERRVTFRLQMFGHPVAVEATISLTGESGLVEAMDSLSSGMWDAWREVFEQRKVGDLKDAPAFHCERIGKEQWRLTDQGLIARNDLETGESSRVFDFVLRRGFFDGEPRLMPDGRISQRLPVTGKGKLERMQRVKLDASPADVSIMNWEAGAQAFAAAFADFLKVKGPEPAAKPPPTKSKPGPGRDEGRAEGPAETSPPERPTPFVAEAPTDSHEATLAQSGGLQQPLKSWARALAELRPRFLEHAGTDLHIFIARVTLPESVWRKTRPAHIPDIIEPLDLPDGEEWRDGKPIIDEGSPWFEQPYRISRSDGVEREVCWERQVYYGQAADALERFRELARAAGGLGYFNELPRASRIHELDRRWMSHVVELACARIPDTALACRTVPMPLTYMLGDYGRLVLWTRLSCNVFQASAWAIDLILDHPPVRVVAEPTPGLICPVCNEPSQTVHADGICETHRSARGTMGRLIVYFENEDLLREQGPCQFVNEVEREPDLPKIRDLSRRLFSHLEFSPNTWRCLLDWLASEHGKEPKIRGTVADLQARHRGKPVPSLYYTPTAEVVALLRAAVKAKEIGSVAQAPAVDHPPALVAQAPADPSPAPTKRKRSTGRGDGRTKLIAALTKHHQYADGGCLNFEPIGNN